MSKKTRGPNFTANEKGILVHLVSKYKAVVENKKTDSVTTASKIEGWKKLTEEFNCESSFYVRNTEQLKTCWDNIKRTTRKDKAATKKQIFLTGGGRPDIPPPGPLQGQVEDLLGPTLDGLNNPYDSDIQFLDQGDLPNMETIIEMIDTKDDKAPAGSSQTFKDESAAVGSSQTSQDNNAAGSFKDDNILTEDVEKQTWSSWTPSALKTKVSNTLSVIKSVEKENDPSTWLHRRRPKTSLQDKVLQSKLELMEIMKKNAQTEAALKELLLQEQLKQEKLRTKILQIEVEKMEKGDKLL